MLTWMQPSIRPSILISSSLNIDRGDRPWPPQQCGLIGVGVREWFVSSGPPPGVYLGPGLLLLGTAGQTAQTGVQGHRPFSCLSHCDGGDGGVSHIFLA